MDFTQQIDFNSSYLGQQKNVIFSNTIYLHFSPPPQPFISLLLFFLSLPSYSPVPPLSTSFIVISLPVLLDNILKYWLMLNAKPNVLVN